LTPDLMRDSRVRSVEWSDLLALSRWEIVKELLLVFPWLTASLLLAHYGYYLLALPISFIFFLTGLRVVHNAYHYAMGISKAATEWVIFALSVMMLSSMHAIMTTHLHHHKHCMDDEDVEAESARMSGAKALLFGPMFYVRIHWMGMKLAPPRRKIWIWSELLANLAILCTVFFVLNIPFLKYHMIAMLVGQCMTAFFAVWTVHHDCDGKRDVARTIRNRMKSLIVFDMFYHLEHHLYPRVPTCHLQELAERLDQAVPEAAQKQVY
jgi:fatty acid desaturase